jgi:hypothetical protein
MSVENLTAGGQIRTRKKNKTSRRSNRYKSRKLKMNIEQEGGGKKPLTLTLEEIYELTYLRLVKLAAVYALQKNGGKRETVDNVLKFTILSSQLSSAHPEFTKPNVKPHPVYTVNFPKKGKEIPHITPKKGEEIPHITHHQGEMKTDLITYFTDIFKLDKNPLHTYDRLDMLHSAHEISLNKFYKLNIGRDDIKTKFEYESIPVLYAYILNNL